MRKLVWNCSILFEIDAVWRHLDADRRCKFRNASGEHNGNDVGEFRKTNPIRSQMRRDAPTTSSSHSIDEYEAG
jgi:hypothetical protein